VCFLLIHHQTREDHPLVLLANRDEYFDRPFEPPALRDEEHGIVAPLDLRGGGTWLGSNAHGVVAAITNRRGDEAAPGLPSRGGLVMDALRCRGALAAGDAIQRRLAGEPYAGFNLLLSDGHDAIVIRHDPSGAGKPRVGAVIELTPGAHVLTNLHELDEILVPLEALPDLDESIEATLRRLEALAENDRLVLPGDHRILKREETRGTVCSAVIATTPDPAAPPVFRFANGVPGEVPFEPVVDSPHERARP
jgi:uncharacterized protein with NRDE domain